MLGDYIVVNDATYSQKEAWRLEELKLNLPPLPEQRAIAHILGTLDDKIELNRRENETLEEMGRALFKSWFVDFDPVHAKAALKQPQRTPPFITPPPWGESARQRAGGGPPPPIYPPDPAKGPRPPPSPNRRRGLAVALPARQAIRRL